MRSVVLDGSMSDAERVQRITLPGLVSTLFLLIFGLCCLFSLFCPPPPHFASSFFTCKVKGVDPSFSKAFQAVEAVV